jgi:hypothetical protein
MSERFKAVYDRMTPEHQTLLVMTLVIVTIFGEIGLGCILFVQAHKEWMNARRAYCEWKEKRTVR